ncbi:MAG: SCO family protein [Alphaproteobacteria bacterium]|nr:SCO family protein [Alphaproteobacteria bacterium]
MRGRIGFGRNFLLSLAVVFVGTGLGGMLYSLGSPLSIVSLAESYHFSLIDHDGKMRTEKDFSQPYKLVYFGFTYCPLICPTELQKMAEAYQKLTPKQQSLIQPLFISVDPERDTPEALKNYVDLFLPNLVGLTGSIEQIESAKRAYSAFSRKVPEGDSYTVDHSSFIYLIGPKEKLLAQFKPSDSSSVLAERLSDLLQEQ